MFTKLDQYIRACFGWESVRYGHDNPWPDEVQEQLDEYEGAMEELWYKFNDEETEIATSISVFANRLRDKQKKYEGHTETSSERRRMYNGINYRIKEIINNLEDMDVDCSIHEKLKNDLKPMLEICQNLAEKESKNE
jgi:predicted transcriptional regulator